MKIKTGIEIECILNTKLFNIEQGRYHEGIEIQGLKNWTAESDSSIQQDSIFSQQKTFEFVSKAFSNRKEFFENLAAFKDYFSKNGKYKLKNVMYFNTSTGSHIHFSIKNFIFADKTHFKIFERTRNYFLKKISKSKIKSRDLIAKNYFRHYAKEITKENWKSDRYEEFNFESEEQKTGLEWRSPNMAGITTWKEFIEFWSIVYNTIEYLEFIRKNYSIKEDIPIDFNLDNKFYLNLKERPIEFLIKKSRKHRSNFKINIDKPKTSEVLICAI